MIYDIIVLKSKRNKKNRFVRACKMLMLRMIYLGGKKSDIYTSPVARQSLAYFRSFVFRLVCTVCKN